MSELAISTIDRHSKRTTMSLPVVAGITNAQAQAVADAWDAVILGSAVSAKITTTVTVDAGSSLPPADKAANRGNKWMARIQDSVNGKIFTYELGTADDSQLPSASNDYLDIVAVGVGLTLKTAIEAAYESSYGNSGVVLSIQQVNRSTNN